MSEYTDEQWDEMVDLLTYIAAADRRTIGNTDVKVWLDAATDAGWPSMTAAYRAVVKHRNEQPGKWLEPGHVTCILDRVRRQASATYQRPTDQQIPMDVLSDPNAYRRHMIRKAQEHQAAYMAAFECGDQLAIEASA